MNIRHLAPLGLAFLASAAQAQPSAPPAPRARVNQLAVTAGPPRVNGNHVLLISVDGLHALDVANYVKSHPTSTLAALAKGGLTFQNASTMRPSDSFPGLVSLVTGGSPKSAGVYYDDSYARNLYAPGTTTAQLATTAPGAETIYHEANDHDLTLLNGGASAAFPGGFDPTNVPVENVGGVAKPLFPHNFLRDNSIFQVVRAAGGYTAWSDKHVVAYDLIDGPDGDHLPGGYFGVTPAAGYVPGVADLYSPEINANFAVHGTNALGGYQVVDRSTAPAGVTITGVNDAPANPVGTSFTATTVGTTSIVNVEGYDDLKVQAILNEIDGKNSVGTTAAPVPSVFGMNFQAVSVGEKLTTEPTPPAGADSDPFVGQHGGYVDAQGTPNVLLASALDYVNNRLGLMVAEINKQGLAGSTTVIISAKHGQSPVNLSLLRTKKASVTVSPLGPVSDPGALLSNVAQETTDDIALFWLKPGASAAADAQTLNTVAVHKASGIQGVLYGPSLNTLYGTLEPSRVPDLVVVPNPGVIYTGSTVKVSEHGGFSHDDTNVALLLAGAGVTPGSFSSTVSTAQVAPTILRLLGLDPTLLKAVQVEGTQPLPGF